MPKKQTEKHREAMRQGMERYRANQKALKAEAKGTTNAQGCETPQGPVQAVAVRYGMQDCKCLHCKQDKGRHTINHWAYKAADELEKNEINRIVLAGDVDYV